MKLLVLAQTPPPVHGQSLMVKTLIDGLPAHGIAAHHINLRLSHHGRDIGRWRLGKIFKTFGAALLTAAARFRHACDTLYYVPAPGKRGALYRDWLLMLFCRPFFRRLVLHWHAVGLGEWLTTRATAPERWITRQLLGRADLALVLAAALQPDAMVVSPRRVAVIANGVMDPGPPDNSLRSPNSASLNVLFLGQCSRAKGLFATIEAVSLINAVAPGTAKLTIAGGFASAAEKDEFCEQSQNLPPDVIHYIGSVDEREKNALFRQADVLCFPTQYPHEGQPLVLIEALAHDVPIVTTRWRAIPDLLPREHIWWVDPAQPKEIAAALLAVRAAPRPHGALRAHYLAHYTTTQHLTALAEALRSIA